MAKRRLSKQQQRRIATQQKNKLKDDDLKLDETSTQTARVISHHGKELYAETDDQRKIKCRIRQNLGDIACGDYVLVQQELHDSDQSEHATAAKREAQNVVVAVKDLDNLLVKTGFAGAVKPVAANIGQLVIVTSIMPRPNTYLIDRYLTSAENLPAKAVIVINKIDLADEEAKLLVDRLSKLYADIGYRVITCSVKQDRGIDELAEALSNTTSILVGLSGVGKSSIVKKILPAEEIKIGQTSEATGEGKHTTTVSALYHLEGNGIIIDSPGVRDFTPITSSLEEISNGFVEIRRFTGHCKFSNCSHQNEPGCAVRQAVEDGDISQQRFDSYLRMIEEFKEATTA